MAEFFAMGGYAFHVWTCWGLTFALLGGLFIARKRKLHQMREIANNMASQTGSEQA